MLGETMNGYVWTRYNNYTARAGQTWDWIAHFAYDNAKLSPILIHANPAYADLLVLVARQI